MTKKNKSTLETDLTGYFPNNTIGAISPEDLRNQQVDIIDSMSDEPVVYINSRQECLDNGTLSVDEITLNLGNYYFGPLVDFQAY